MADDLAWYQVHLVNQAVPSTAVTDNLPVPDHCFQPFSDRLTLGLGRHVKTCGDLLGVQWFA